MAERYLGEFRDNCYDMKQDGPVLKEDLAECSERALEKTNQRDQISEAFKNMDTSIDFDQKSVKSGSNLFDLIMKNVEYEEKSLSITPSIKINNQVIMVKIYFNS